MGNFGIDARLILDTNGENVSQRLSDHDLSLAQITKQIQFVTYAQFGANGQKKYYNSADGKYYLDSGFTQVYTHDDGIEIKAAHDYANANNLPIKNTNGEYVILGTRNIQIQTNVDWGNSVFHVDESLTPVNNGQPFTVSSVNQPFNLDSSQFSTILPYLVKGTTSIPALSQYRNHFVKVVDTTTQVGVRYSGNNTPQGGSWSVEEIFVIDENGKLIGDITWNFTNISTIQLVKCDSNYLTINGGGFLLNGKLFYTSSNTEYKNNGIYVNRSRVRIKDQFCGFDNAQDTETASSGGVYSFYQCYDVSLENVKLMPRKYFSVGGVPQGTYGIAATEVLNWVLKDVTAQGDGGTVWGVLGTNYIKDWKVYNCTLNRIDTHFHAWNVSIEDSKVGDKGIELSGGGRLYIKNTSVEGVTFCNFRGDYGSIWDGNIIVESCKLLVNDTNYADPSAGILEFFPYQGNYGQPIIFGNHITVKNFTFDYSLKPSNTSQAWLVRFSTYQTLYTGQRMTFPSYMDFQNVDVVGRSMGVTFFNIPFPQSVQTNNQCAYTIGAYDVDIVPNAVYKFDNIYTSEIVGLATDTNNYHFFLGAQNNSTYTDNYSLVPKIAVSNCEHVSLQPKGSICKIVMEKCSITTIDAYGNYGGQSKIDFIHCEFRPNVSGTTNLAYIIGSNEISFVNCKVYPYKVNGVADLNNTIKGKIGFLGEDATSLYVIGTHLGTKLNKAILQYMDTNSSFVAKMPTYLDELAASQHRYYNGKYYL